MIRLIFPLVLAMSVVARAGSSDETFNDGKTHWIGRRCGAVSVGLLSHTTRATAGRPPTTVEILHAASIALLTCGNQSAIEMSGGAVNDSHLHGNCRLRLGGGAVEMLDANDDCQLAIDGGTAGTVHAWQRVSIIIQGGSIDVLGLFDQGRLTMNGGSVQILQAREDNHVDISGGHVEVLNGFGNADIHLTGGTFAGVSLMLKARATLNGSQLGHMGFGGDSTGVISSGRWGRALAVADNSTVDVSGGSGGTLAVSGGTLNLHGRGFFIWCDKNSTASTSLLSAGASDSTHIVGTLSDGTPLDAPLLLSGGTIIFPDRRGRPMHVSPGTIAPAVMNATTTPAIAVVSLRPRATAASGVDDDPAGSSQRAAARAIAAVGLLGSAMMLRRGWQRRAKSGKPLAGPAWAAATLLLLTGISLMWARSYLHGDYWVHHDGISAHEIFSNGCSIGLWKGPDYVVGDDAG